MKDQVHRAYLVEQECPIRLRHLSLSLGGNIVVRRHGTIIKSACPMRMGRAYTMNSYIVALLLAAFALAIAES